MTRSFGGRARQYQRLTRIKPNRAPVPVFGVEYLETFPNDGNFSDDNNDLEWLYSDVTGYGFQAATVTGGQLFNATAPGFYAAEAQGDTSTQDQYVQIAWTGTPASNDDIRLHARCEDLLAVNYPATSDQNVSLYVYYAGGDAGYVEIAGWNPYTSLDFIAPGPSPVFNPQGTWRLEVEGDEARAYHDSVLLITSDISGLSPAAPGKKAGFTMENNPNAGMSVDNFEYGDL